MENYKELRKQLDEVLKKREKARHEERRQIQESMEALDRRQSVFKDLAPRLFKKLVEPRLKLLEEYFQDAKYMGSEDGRHGTVIFNRDRRYSASVILTMGFTHDYCGDNAILSCHLQIIPVLIEYQSMDSCSFPLSAPDEDQISSFVEKRIFQCAGDYIKVQEEPSYRKDSMVVDPVCGMTIHRLDAAATAVHEMETYYFCVPACRDRFLENPRRYVQR